ncbi:MAG: hypothetical protein EBZ48_04720 [Proteobacteria bacterium]|nr:hypothetical protein [Pseudomonadota bacterium]
MQRKLFIFGAGALGLRMALALHKKHPVLVARHVQRSRVLVRTSAALSAASATHATVTAIGPVGTLAVRGLLEHLRPLINPTHTIVLAQNGIGISEIAASFVPESQIVRLTARLGALKIAAFSIIPTGPIAVTVACVADAALKAAEVRTLFSECGAQVSIAPTVAACEWQKTALNLVTNSLATILDSHNSIVLEDPELWRLAGLLLSEYRAVAAAEGVTLDHAASPETIRTQIEAVGANINSTLADLRAGRASEIPWMLGAVVQRGRAHGVAVPVAETLLSLLASMERLALLQRPG